MLKSSRCPYRYISLTASQVIDNQCVLSEGHIGEHVKREIFPPVQPYRVQEGWVKFNDKIVQPSSGEQN